MYRVHLECLYYRPRCAGKGLVIESFAKLGDGLVVSLCLLFLKNCHQYDIGWEVCVKTAI